MGICVVENNEIIETNASTNIHIYDEVAESEIQDKEFNIAFLGELMMGGNIGKDLSYNYMSAFKNISEHTSKADYTVVNLATNIIDLKELNDTKSKYIVTKNIENAFSALGVDGIRQAYETGRGKIFVRAKAVIEKNKIIIKSIGCGLNFLFIK